MHLTAKPLLKPWLHVRAEPLTRKIITRDQAQAVIFWLANYLIMPFPTNKHALLPLRSERAATGQQESS
jgi:hypothetical protein